MEMGGRSSKRTQNQQPRLMGAYEQLGWWTGKNLSCCLCRGPRSFTVPSSPNARTMKLLYGWYQAIYGQPQSPVWLLVCASSLPLHVWPPQPCSAVSSRHWLGAKCPRSLNAPARSAPLTLEVFYRVYWGRINAIPPPISGSLSMSYVLGSGEESLPYLAMPRCRSDYCCGTTIRYSTQNHVRRAQDNTLSSISDPTDFSPLAPGTTNYSLSIWRTSPPRYPSPDWDWLRSLFARPLVSSLVASASSALFSNQ